MKISSAFTTKYASKCSSCGTSILPGAAALYVDDEIIGEACCGDEQSRGERARGESAAGLSMIWRMDQSEEKPSDPIALTMPRGRSARDRCDRCFQIPSSNGVCGCD